MDIFGDKRKDEVLIITYDMIPYANSWGGSQRMYYLAEYLIKNGINVTVFSCKKNKFNDYGNNINFNHESVPIKNKLLRNFLYSRGQISKNIQKSENVSLNIFAFLRRYIKNNNTLFNIVVSLDRKIFNEPSFLSGLITRSWYSDSYKKIKEHILNKNAKSIIISGPPFGMFSISRRLKTDFSQINLIFDYRDPWNLWKDNGFFAKYLEKKYLKYADKIICTNENLANDMSKVYSIEFSKFEVIKNGFSEYAWSNIDCKKRAYKDFLTITYAGAIDISHSSKSSYRDISILVEAFRQCRKNGMNIKLQFIGVNDVNSNLVQELKVEFEGDITIMGVLDNKDANLIMSKSDVLLLLHTTHDSSSRYIISGKMYDYIRAGKFIFSIGDPKGIHSKIVDTANLGITSDNNYEEIQEKLSFIYDLWVNEKIEICIDSDLIQKSSREYQNKKYMKLLI
ncbi:MAG TPA: glycosyltransferase family 4 protein [Gallicola sp.]|nr:glycosyltransferase family 4 protein [Gallicola sp.]